MLGGIDDAFDYRVKIPFSTFDVTNMADVKDRITNWNEVCASAIELFGLPGDKYQCKFTKSCIEFWFLDEKDAMLFELTCG